METVHDFPYRVRSIENLWIPLPDGTRLAARAWIPEAAEATPVPAILEYIPYRKRDFTRPRDDIMHGYFAGHGYACLRVDLRGSGETEGLRTLSRGDWAVTVRTRTVMTSDADRFHLRAELDGYEGGRRVHSHNLERSIARDLM